MSPIHLDLSATRQPRMPILETARLRLRPFVPDDAAMVQRLAGDWEIASTTLHIPHPYPDGAAEEWIETHGDQFAGDQGLTLAITLREENLLVGAIGLEITRAHQKADLGYWVGRKHWGQGLATEAVLAVIDHGFRRMALNRIEAHHFTRNPASGRVMIKAGMTYEGCERQSLARWGKLEDVACYAILREEWEALPR